MKNLLFLLCSLVLSVLIFSCQNHENQSEENTTDLGNLSNLSQAVYGKIKAFDVIMIGEMHGTQEPARLVYSLAKLIADNEGEVYVGLEIPEQQINLSNDELDPENLLNTPFFIEQEYSDGRNGQSWFDLMVNCGADKRINVFFIDNFTTSSRDSSMYIEVKKIKELHPKNKILTLTGNIHNRLIPFREKATMGVCILEDERTFEPSKIMSIGHYYKEGTMRNSMRGEFKIREAKGRDLSELSKYKNFMGEMFEEQDAYNYFFYTEKVNHSAKIEYDNAR